jgi:hypothetical protein
MSEHDYSGEYLFALAPLHLWVDHNSVKLPLCDYLDPGIAYSLATHHHLALMRII